MEEIRRLYITASNMRAADIAALEFGAELVAPMEESLGIDFFVDNDLLHLSKIARSFEQAFEQLRPVHSQ
jgi:hypothetical protein